MTKEIMDRAVNRFTEEVKKEYGEKFEAVILFGSYARGDYEDDSDLDLMVLLQASSEEIVSLRDRILPIISRLDVEFDYDILFSPIVQSSRVFEKNISVIPFYRNVDSEGG